jgi:hypothetical protein
VCLDAIGILIFGIKYNYLDSGRNRATPVHPTLTKNSMDSRLGTYMFVFYDDKRYSHTTVSDDIPRCPVQTTVSEGGTQICCAIHHPQSQTSVRFFDTRFVVRICTLFRRSAIVNPFA